MALAEDARRALRADPVSDPRRAPAPRAVPRHPRRGQSLLRDVLHLPSQVRRLRHQPIPELHVLLETLNQEIDPGPLGVLHRRSSPVPGQEVIGPVAQVVPQLGESFELVGELGDRHLGRLRRPVAHNLRPARRQLLQLVLHLSLRLAQLLVVLVLVLVEGHARHALHPGNVRAGERVGVCVGGFKVALVDGILKVSRRQNVPDAAALVVQQRGEGGGSVRR
mmetsp:Transcript_12970/g.52213  ORF Transcript_12970/g.52213 Transcript_12970/m.52213 type:complete len:222 (-) Transcript_12970:1357-2022(-)